MSQEILKQKLLAIQSLVDESLAMLGAGDSIAREAKTKKSADANLPGSINYELPDRAFIKKYGKGLKSGHQKFSLLLAYMTKGSTSIEIEGSKIEKLWNTMTSHELLGMKFNGAFATRAKENGWVNSTKLKMYKLESGWNEIFSPKK